MDGSLNNFEIPQFQLTNQSAFFFIKTIYGQTNSQINYSDTISSIAFDLVNLYDGTVSLSWQHPFDIELIESSSFYVVEKSFPNTSTVPIWEVVANLSKDSTSYLDHIGVCASNINYRVKLVTENCEFISNIDGGFIEDQQAPDSPVLLNVTTDTSTNYLNINWLPSVAEDVSAYIIFKFFSGFWNPIDTVYGYQNTFYTDTNIVSFRNEIVKYAIAAMDSCSFGSPPQNNTSSAGLEHQNIVLTNNYEKCSGEIILNWNEYVNFPRGLGYYEIYYKNDIVSWTLLDTTKLLEYSHTIEQKNLNYSFIVKAIDSLNIHSSISNQLSFYASQAAVPQFSYISSVNVSGDSIILTYDSENNIGIKKVNIYRSDDNGTTYENIFSKINPIFPIIYNDLSVAPHKKSYLYIASVIDSCNHEVGFSNLGSSILLENDGDGVWINNIKWNPYLKWQFGVESYEIILNNNTNSSFQTIANLDSSNNVFSHNFQSTINYPFDGRQCYKVRANEIINDFGDKNQSISNELCIQSNPLIYAPNAINVKGLNNSWKPIINMVDFSEVKISIYNRNGELIFSMFNHYDSWSGLNQITGSLAASGIYVYVIELRNGTDQIFTKKGHITVLN